MRRPVVPEHGMWHRNLFRMLWIKAFHVIFVVTWFAGLFYLPRLFVYHVDCEEEAGQARFKTMERKLLAITTIGGIAALAFGLMLLPYWQHAFTFDTLWMPTKLVLVAALVAYHGYLWLLTRRFANDRNRHGQRYFRIINEVPALILIAVVVLVVVKPI